MQFKNYECQLNNKQLLFRMHSFEWKFPFTVNESEKCLFCIWFFTFFFSTLFVLVSDFSFRLTVMLLFAVCCIQQYPEFSRFMKMYYYFYFFFGRGIKFFPPHFWFFWIVQSFDSQSQLQCSINTMSLDLVCWIFFPPWRLLCFYLDWCSVLTHSVWSQLTDDFGIKSFVFSDL